MKRIDAESETLIAHSLRADGFDASEDETGRGTPLVPVGFDLAQITSSVNRSNPQPGDPQPPLCSGGQPHVAIGFYGNDSGNDAGVDISPTLRSMEGGGGNHPSVAVQESQTGCREYDTAGALRSNGPGHDPVGTRIRDRLAVRRLTPLECERLQGFPDGWTDITYRGKPAADGPRYKALGNSMAVPVMRWILSRIQEVERIAESARRSY